MGAQFYSVGYLHIARKNFLKIHETQSAICINMRIDRDVIYFVDTTG